MCIETTNYYSTGSYAFSWIQWNYKLSERMENVTNFLQMILLTFINYQGFLRVLKKFNQQGIFHTI
jgi:hypothetical protein